MTNKLIYLALGLALLNSKGEDKSRNKSNAKELGWGTEYNNENPYPGSVKYDENKEYVGLNYDLIFDGKEYSGKLRREKHLRVFNPLGNKKNILHQKYSPKVLKKGDVNLKKGDIITGIQFRITTGYRSGVIGEPSGNREWSTPSNFESTCYQISLGNSENLKLTKDYQTNLNQINDFKLVKQGVKWEDKEWPFGKVPLNDFGPILKFDHEFIYQGDDLFLEIYYYDKQSSENVYTYAQGFEKFSDNLTDTTFFSYIDKTSVSSIEKWILDIQFEVIRNKEN
tara:strand:+ start:910 stop:1755 length:846 start_codon:yes stop_codon:yes gene_type:complete